MLTFPWRVWLKRKQNTLFHSDKCCRAETGQSHGGHQESELQTGRAWAESARGKAGPQLSDKHLPGVHRTLDSTITTPRSTAEQSENKTPIAKPGSVRAKALDVL